MIRLAVVAAIWLVVCVVNVIVLLTAQWVSNNGPVWLLNPDGQQGLGICTSLALLVIVLSTVFAGIFMTVIAVDGSFRD